jgi:hypothetical protein
VTRYERKVERMRTQRLGHAKRAMYRTSGTPHLARPAIWGLTTRNTVATDNGHTRKDGA